MKIVTCVAPVNIAVIKYWGKRDEELILPINDSISSTLSTDHMCSKTTIMASPDFTVNRFWLNGKEETFGSKRLNNCLSEVRKRADPNAAELLNWKIHICSENNFPTAAGLASSAAGYACLVASLAALYGVKGDISGIARKGSGSACRSVYDGWVQWHQGVEPSGEDSIATRIAAKTHWPEMRIVILVTSDSEKLHSSTSGMKTSVETSELLKHRADVIVPRRVDGMTKAILERNFDEFAKITMQDSNQFHAMCLDTFPPIVYMNDTSHAIVRMVHEYNRIKGSNKLAYTFDAGSNACLYMLEPDVEEVLSVIYHVFPPNPETLGDYMRGIQRSIKPASHTLMAHFKMEHHRRGCLKYIICTEVGDGPQILTSHDSHLLGRDGLPNGV